LQQIFAGADTLLTCPYARQTNRMRTIIRLFGHGVGGRPSERIMARLGMPIPDTSPLVAIPYQGSKGPLNFLIPSRALLRNTLPGNGRHGHQGGPVAKFLLS